MRPDADLVARLESLALLDLDPGERALLAERLTLLLASVSVLRNDAGGSAEDVAPSGPTACPRRDDAPASAPVSERPADPLGDAPRDDRGLVPTPPPSGRSDAHG